MGKLRAVTATAAATLMSAAPQQSASTNKSISLGERDRDALVNPSQAPSFQFDMCRRI